MTYFLKALVICALALWPTSANASENVALRADKTVTNATIFLSDVFEGVETEQDREIALAPLPGKSVTYDSRVLRSLSGRYALGWTPEGADEKIVLTRAATVISPDMIRKAVALKITGNEKDAALLDVRFDNRVLGLTLPASETDSFDLAGFDYDRVNQRFRADVVAQNGDQPVIQAIMGRVAVQRKIPVLAHALATGTIVGEGDLNWVVAEENRVSDDILTSAEQIVGQELTRNKGEGERLRVRDLTSARIVRRGELVTLRIETDRILITTQGKAIKDGGMGEVVRVTNTQSNRTVEGTVVAPGVVQVGAFKKMAAVE